MGAIVGTIFNDTRHGGSGTDWGRLYSGNDTVYARGGNDYIDGGAGHDRLYGESGNDKLIGDSGTDLLAGGSGDDWLYGGSGDDQLYGDSGSDVLDGGLGTDLVSFWNAGGGVTLNLGSTGTVDIWSSTQIHGKWFHFSDDYVRAFIAGGEVDYVANVENIDGSSYGDRITGDAGINRIDGRDGDDTLSGGGGNDFLYGEGGDDTIEGGAGGDVLDGGWGDDTLSYAGSNARVYVNLETNRVSGGHAAGDSVRRFENIQGSRYDDDLRGDAGSNTIRGGSGDDTLYGGNGNDTLYGQYGNDTLYGGSGDDTLSGGSGSDTYHFSRNGEHDTIQADYSGYEYVVFDYVTSPSDLHISRNDNNDVVITVANSSNSVTIEAGSYRDGRYSLYDHSGTLLIRLSSVGTNSADTIQGGVGDGTLYGGAGTDTYLFFQGDGNDIINDDGGNLQLRSVAGYNELNAIHFSRNDDGDVVATIGADSVTLYEYADGRYSLYIGGTGDEDGTLLGQLYATTEDANDNSRTGITNANNLLVGLDDQANYLYGANLADVLLGQGGDDTLRGNDGDDVLVGGAGSDTLEGGAGDDQYRFFAGDSTGTGDRIQSDIDGGGLYFGDVDTLADFSFSNRNGNFVVTVNNDKVVVTHDAQAPNLHRQGIYKLYYGADDTLAGKLYIDTADNNGLMRGSNKQDFLIGLEGTDIISGDAGNDVLMGGLGGDTLKGGAGEDIYLFSSGDGTDRIEGDSRGADESEKILFASVTDSQDFAISRNTAGDVTITVNSDRVIIDNSNAYEHGRYKIYHQGNEGPYGTLLGSLYVGIEGQANRLAGSDEKDIVVGASEGDRLKGKKGDDILEGGAGDDEYYFYKGDGRDTIRNDRQGQEGLYFKDVDDPSDIVFDTDYGDKVIRIKNSEDSVTIASYSYQQGRYDIYYDTNDAPHMQASPGAGDDVPSENSASDPTSDSGDADDDFPEEGWTKIGALYVGTDDYDILRGTAEKDFIDGLSNDDTLYGEGGDDLLRGSEGDDTLEGGDGEDALYGGTGDDMLQGGVGADSLEGGDGEDALYGGTGDDMLQGGVGADSLEGGDGEDALYGGTGDDTLRGGVGADFLEGGDGEDRLYGDAGNDELYGSAGADLLHGGVGADTLYGGAGDDVYRFDAGDSFDVIVDYDTTGNNKVIFRSPDGYPYDSDWDFYYTRGTYDSLDADTPFAASLDGDDLKIEVESWDLGSVQNTVYIVDYYGEDVFTIYNAAFGSAEDGTLVYAPSELG